MTYCGDFDSYCESHNQDDLRGSNSNDPVEECCAEYCNKFLEMFCCKMPHMNVDREDVYGGISKRVAEGFCDRVSTSLCMTTPGTAGDKYCMAQYHPCIVRFSRPQTI